MKKETIRKPAELWLDTYQSHAPSQRALARELKGIGEMLNAYDEGFRVLFHDEQFITLLRAEGLDRVPTVIIDRTR